MSVIGKIEQYGTEILYLLVAIAIAVPILNPIGLPVKIGADSRVFYELIESLPPGAIVHYGIDPEIGGFEELRSRMVVIGKHLFEKDVKLVFIGFDPNAPPIYNMLIADIGVPSDKEYGKDYVFLGYLPGKEIAIASYAKDIHSLISVDFFGTPLDELELMDEIRDITDFDLAMSFSSHGLPLNYVDQIYVPYNVPLGVCIIGVMAPAIRPYYPDQISGFLSTPRNGAEYELLANKPGIGIADFDAQTIAHVILLIFIVSGNLIEIKQRDK